ncbi:hypothetical protein N8824_04750 [Candidatus Pelagibacter sp.]|nr:hypothetical protein [Candidatus Pelagibacter sp.]
MFEINRKEARLIILQRIELINNSLKKIRKIFGRYIFSNFISKYFLSTTDIAKLYYENMHQEFESIKSAIGPLNKSLLSIGGGLGGLELIINKEIEVKHFTFIERNYISKKVIYGWDNQNNEAYNNVEIQRNFLIKNGMLLSKFSIFDYDNNKLPEGKFDIIISLFSMDYHYNFDIYSEYLKKNTHEESKIVFDTIRPDYFKNIFEQVFILEDRTQIIHGSKRIVCSKFFKS